MDGSLEGFEALQREKLRAGWEADLPGSTTPHVVLGLPSYSVDRSVSEHYGSRLSPLENRYLYVLLVASSPAAHVVFLSSLQVPPEIRDGYLALAEPECRPAILERSRVVSPDDASPRPLAEKLLDRGDLIDEVRRLVGDRPALIEAWNVTEAEAAFAVAVGAPVNGTHPGLRDLATKSNGRTLLRDAGVPVPDGCEDVRTPADVVRAVAALQSRRPGLRSVVVKLDDSVAGDGNVVVAVDSLPQGRDGRVSCGEDGEAAVAAVLPEWYRPVLRAGGVVEERIEGDEFRSPSAQATITPAGDVAVLATHEQRLGGPDKQVFEGCTFPADRDYAPVLGAYAEAAGRRLAEAGAVGRFAVDFVVRRRPSGSWDVYAVEINLRKGGTTHPLGVSRLLRGGVYDAGSGRCVSGTGRETCYVATDNLVDERWVGRPVREVRAVIEDRGLAFDRRTGTGVVPHLLDCLRVDGRMGYTVLADSEAGAAELERRLLEALSG